MGMMLRRHKRVADSTPTVNGAPVKREPKTHSLTENKVKATPTITPTIKI